MRRKYVRLRLIFACRSRSAASVERVFSPCVRSFQVRANIFLSYVKMCYIGKYDVYIYIYLHICIRKYNVYTFTDINTVYHISYIFLVYFLTFRFCSCVSVVRFSATCGNGSPTQLGS